MATRLNSSNPPMRRQMCTSANMGDSVFDRVFAGPRDRDDLTLGVFRARRAPSYPGTPEPPSAAYGPLCALALELSDALAPPRCPVLSCEQSAMRQDKVDAELAKEIKDELDAQLAEQKSACRYPFQHRSFS